jgi:hypothetical protein
MQSRKRQRIFAAVEFEILCKPTPDVPNFIGFVA